MRLLVVVILGLITAYWAVYAIYLLFLPEGSAGATAAVLFGAICLVIAGVYAFVAWGTAKRSRGLHIAALVVSVLGVLGLALGQTVDVMILSAVNLVAAVLLSQTIPVGTAKS